MDISSIIKGGFLLAILLLFGLFTYDQFFAPPKIHQGIILNKVFIPEHTATSQNVASYGRARTYKYIVQVQKFHQWVAVVKADDGDTLKVHCNSSHFNSTNIGDTLLFKEYKGEIFGIDYLAHSDEDTVKSDLRILR
jgi:hypothetical protein